ncbi:glycosyltransferase family 4 protein [Sphingomonas sp. KRR8]|uniref:glycosyltransferase family 4 protein n=1 Tax=Sphingomonas sp. KRR8 TaxID=2942996 RepID=UPI0020225EC9|nr:glycosyltransferase family 4 protein [Sphingomonas sp. KRR8]URD60793.1 glycosyltransferase family 4 protein [Sphingomonas sp. KRR8]
MIRRRLLLTTDAVGGVWTYSLDLAREVAAQDDMVVLLAVLGPAPNAEQLDAAAAIPGLQLIDTGLPLDWTAGSAEEVRAAANALALLAEQSGADLVQIHAPALALASYPVPVITVVHSCVATWWSAIRSGSLPADLAWRRDLATEGLRRSDLLAAPSRSFATALRDTYGLKHAPIDVPNGRVPLTAGSEIAPGGFVLTTGRLWDEGKNIATFDQAAALTALPFRAAGASEGPNGAAIQLRHAEALGQVDESTLTALLSKRPIFVSPARYEPFGLSVLEAAQAGCPLVLSDIPTFRELWDGAALFADTAEQIAAAVERLTGEDEARRFGDAARTRATRFSPQATARAMLTHYNSLLGRERRAAA